MVGGTRGKHFVQVPEGSRRSDAIRKIAWHEAYTRVCAIRREGAGETNLLRTVVGVWLGVRNNSAQKVFSERERIEQQDRWDTEAVNNVIGVPRKMIDGKWTVDRPATQIDPLPPPLVPFEGARVQRERITRTDIEAFGTTAGCQGCNAIRSGKRAQAHSDPCRVRLGECLKTTPEGSER